MSTQPTEGFRQEQRPEDDPLYTGYFANPDKVHRENISNNVDEESKDGYNAPLIHEEYYYGKLGFMDGNVKDTHSTDPNAKRLNRAFWLVCIAGAVGVAASVALMGANERKATTDSNMSSHNALILR
jgi:hypothetical protein